MTTLDGQAEIYSCCKKLQPIEADDYLIKTMVTDITDGD
jgi:hypothetical protein